MKRLISLYLMFCFSMSPVLANNLPNPNPNQLITPPNASQVTNFGVAVPVKFLSTINGKGLKAGQTLNLVIVNDVYSNNQILFKQGAMGTAVVSKVKRPFLYGTGGEILINSGQISDVNGKIYNVELNIDEKGKTRNWSRVLGVVGLIALPLTAFGLFPGKHCEIQSNRVFVAYVTM